MSFKKIHKKINKQTISPLIISVMAVIVFFLNYSPGTWQTGWDTIHPEFNFALNIPRHLFGIWQDNQGLGSVGGHSHAADISRILILFFSSAFLPLNFLRYFYLLITLITGPLAVYFFAKKVIFTRDKFLISELSALIAGLFYLFNLGTVNTYIVQFEMYTSLFGFLPLLFLSSTLFLQKRNTKNFIFLALSSFFVGPSGYSYAVFFSAFFVLIIYLASYFFLSKFFSEHSLKAKYLVFTVFVIFLVNSYWILPSGYFAMSGNSQFVSESNINTLFSNEIYETNIKYGNIYNLLTNKGFLTNWKNYNFATKEYYSLFENWNIHLSTVATKFFVEPVIVLFLLVGFFASFKKNIKSASLIPAFLLCAFMFLNSNLPFGFLFDFVRDHNSIFREMYRNPYTKFSIPLIFISGLFFALSFNFIVSHISFVFNKIKRKIVYFLTFLFAFLMLISYSFPMFRGNLISKDIRINIPNYYFEFFEYMKNQPDAKIAYLPAASFWGWEYHSWGYQGAGFMWFGLKQPFLARDFDRWNTKNQNYYNDIFNAIYRRDSDLLVQNLKKYDIGYIVFDSSIISPDFGDVALQKDKTLNLLYTNNSIEFVQKFGSIYLFKNKKPSGYVYTPVEKEIPIDFPFANIQRPLKSAGIDLEINSNITISKTVKVENGEYLFQSGQYAQNEETIPVNLYLKQIGKKTYIKTDYIIPEIFINNESVNFSFPQPEYSFENTEKNFYLTLNGQIFYIEDLSATYKIVATALFSTTSDNLFYLYKTTPAELNRGYSKNPLTFFKNCSEGQDQDILFSKTEVFMASYTDTACISQPNILVKGLLMADVQFVSSTQSVPSLCFNQNNKCLRDLFYSNNQHFATNGGEAKWYFENTANSVQPELQLYPNPQEGVSNLRVQDYTYSVFPIIRELSISKIDTQNILASLTFTKRIQVLDNKVDVKAVYKKYALASFTGDSLFSKSSIGFFENETSNKRRILNTISYKTNDGGILYDKFIFGKIPDRVSYFIGIDSTNEKGNPLNIIMSEPTTSLYLLDSLNTVSKVFGVYRIFSSDSSSPFTNFSSISFLSQSISGKESVNTLKEVSFYPANLNWLSDFTIKKSNNLSTINAGYVAESKKIAPFLYGVENAVKKSPIVLSQTYDWAWITIPFSTNHNLYKGWANVWEAPSDKFIIVFLPSLFQFCLYPIIVLLLFVLKKRFEKRN